MTSPDDPTLPPDEPFPQDAPAAPEEIAAPASSAPPPPPAEPPVSADAEDQPPPLPSPPRVVAVTGRVPAPVPPPASRPDLLDRQEPLYRSCGGYRLRLEPADLARLRELPGSRGKSDEELGESFFDGQAERLAASVAGDVPSGAELRVVVDPYSRQAFVALENRIRGILSF
jgi:hypothetical protein